LCYSLIRIAKNQELEAFLSAFINCKRLLPSYEAIAGGIKIGRFLYGNTSVLKIDKFLH
jgi:hypothetical protein